MDFHAAMETFAEAWVAANTPTAVNTDTQNPKPAQIEELPTLVNKDPNKQVEPVSGPPHGHSTDSGSSGAKSIPIHCVIEQTSGPVTFESNEGASHTTVELDSYAILPSTTLFSELVRASLVKLGYSSTEAMNAKGAIQIKNWKPLLFEVITSDTKATIEDILGELTQVATLRIRLCSKSKLSTTDEVKDKLLQLLLTQSQGLLVNSGCPIEKTLLSSISKGETYDNLSPEVRRAFDKWYEQQINKQTEKMPEQKEMPRPAHDAPVDRSLVRNTHTPPSDLSTNRQHIPSSTPSLTPPLLPHGKTRMRTSFDPEHEIPRLQKWFSDNQHPTREQMIHYLDELNRLDSRKGRRPLDLTNIIYWFKNARAAHRRASKNYDDSSFEMEEGLEGSPGAVDSNLPYLPNKNAVYIVPYPFHGPYMSNNLQHDSKEPCDLSQSRKATSTPVPVSSPSPVKQEPYSQEDSSLLEETPFKKSEDEAIEKEDHENCNNQNKIKYEEHSEESCEDQKDNGSTDEKMEVNHDGQNEALNGEQQNIRPIKKEDNENSETCSNHLLNGALNDEKRLVNDDVHPYTNGIQHSDSEDDDEFMDTDDEDNGSKSNDESDSSHDANLLSIKRDEDGQSFRNSVMQHMSRTSNALQQPLHIPHFPHPLAMHYFPMNTHFMQQTAARFHQHQQQQQQHHHHQQENHQHHQKSSPGNSHHRKRRTRVFIDPMSEIPKLEKWFLDDTHPSSYMIDKYCEELNRSDYRQKFPKLEPKNVQLWFKNHRAKVKRMRISIN